MFTTIDFLVVVTALVLFIFFIAVFLAFRFLRREEIKTRARVCSLLESFTARTGMNDVSVSVDDPEAMLYAVLQKCRRAEVNDGKLILVFREEVR